MRTLARHRLTKRRGLLEDNALLQVPTLGARFSSHLPPWASSLSPTAMTSSPIHTFTSLAHIYEKYCKVRGLNSNEAAEYVIREQQKGDASQLQIYQDVCNIIVPNNVLSKYLSARFVSLAQMSDFKRQFAVALSTDTAVRHFLSSGSLAPHQLVFSLSNGSILTGFPSPFTTTKESVPFRLTRNVEQFFTTLGLEASYVSTFMDVAIALNETKAQLQSYLSVYLHQEGTDYQQQTEQVNAVLQRIGSVTCSVPVPIMGSTVDAKKVPNTCVSAKVWQLVQAATDSSNLASMPIHWQPWL